MKNENKILYFSVLSQMAGAENSLFDIINEMSKDEKYSIGVVVPNSGEFSEKLRSLNIQIFFLSKNPISSFRKIILYPFNLFKIIQNFKPNILHSNTKGCIKYMLLSRLFLKFKWIQHIRGNFIKGDFKLFHKLFINFSDIRIGISNSVKNSYNRQNDKNFLILYNAFNFNNFKEKLSKKEITEFKNQLNIPLNKKIILNIGRFTLIKRQELLIKSAKYHKDLLFLFIGEAIFNRKEDKRYYEKIKTLARVLENVRFFGWRNDLYKFYSIADLYIHTSETEAFGRVLVEAIYYKTSVIVPPNDGMKEIIENGNVGIFFNNTVNDLQKKIEHTLKNYPDDNELERRKNKVLQLYSMDNYIQKLKRIYEQAIK